MFGQNPKIGCQECNDLQTPKLSKKQLCDRTRYTAYHILRSGTDLGAGWHSLAHRHGANYMLRACASMRVWCEGGPAGMHSLVWRLHESGRPVGSVTPQHRCTVARHGFILPFLGLMSVVPDAGKHAGAPRTQEPRALHDHIAQ